MIDEDGYAGPATVLVAGSAVACEVTVRGHFEPIDGRYHWYGRLAPDPQLTELVTGMVAASIATPHGTAEGKLGDPDPWGRLRISGVGRPPFAVALSLADVESAGPPAQR